MVKVNMIKKFGIKVLEDKHIFALFGNRNFSYDKFKNNPDSFDFYRKNKFPVIQPNQTHSDKIVWIDNLEKIDLQNITADGIITSIPDCYLSIKTADCIPIFLYDPKKQIIGAIHAGREGIRLNIIGKAFNLMKSKGSCYRDIQVAIGPAISVSYYPVKPLIYKNFVNDTGIEQYPFKLNLRKVLNFQLKAYGINNIIDVNVCTWKNDNFFSYRREVTQDRQLNFIGMLNENI
jgi:YfiH family protein